MRYAAVLLMTGVIFVLWYSTPNATKIALTTSSIDCMQIQTQANKDLPQTVVVDPI